MKIHSEPYRLFFPLGVASLLCGILLWIPLIWNESIYPVLLHRYLVINGFAGCFIGGFLMTAIPRFSKTFEAKSLEIGSYLGIFLCGIILAHTDNEQGVFIASAFQPAIILAFMLSRFSKRKENPPFSFVFIFIGLMLWLGSSLASAFIDSYNYRPLHHEGAIAAIILGVGGRLLPGILGHVAIVTEQRQMYEKPLPIYATVPLFFWAVILIFVSSYFVNEEIGNYLRLFSVSVIAFKYWRLFQFPAEKTTLTWSIWISGYMIVVGFLLKCLWPDGGIHAGHAFFINGIVLLSLLVATRVIQSHGPKDKSLENSKVLYVITGLIIFASATRISAYALPDSYLRHLAYSSIVLATAVLTWSWKYLRYVRS